MKNLQIDSGGTGEHSSISSITALAGRGIEFVNISPLRTDQTDALKAEWLPAIPGTDTAIMMGLAHTLVAEGLHDAAFIERYTVGFDKFRRYLTGQDDGQPKDAAWAARITGIDAETIRKLARRMAGTRTFITTTWSLQRADHGEQPIWMTIVLAAILGQIGLPGGGFGFGYGSMNRMGQGRSPVAALNRPVGRSPLNSYIPVARISDLLLHPGETIDYNGQRITFPEIKLIYWCGGNPFHHHQDINRLVQAWQRPETVIVHEIFWTPTARYADIVLPATTTLERNDIASSSDRYMFAMHQAIEPVGEARNDFDIFADLGERLGFRDDFTEGRSEMEWLRHLYEIVRQQAARHGIERPDFETFWQEGYIADPVAKHYDYLSGYRADPVGKKLKTPSGKIEIFSEKVASFGYDDCPGHPMWIEPAEWLGSPKADRKLHLVSNQPTMRLAWAARQRAGEPRLQGEGARAGADQPGGRRRARHRRRRRGAAVQRARRLPRRRGGDRGDDPRRRATADRRLVRSRSARPYRHARPPRQSECAHPRQGHLETGAGPDFADHPGRDRALDRTGARDPRFRSASGGGTRLTFNGT